MNRKSKTDELIDRLDRLERFARESAQSAMEAAASAVKAEDSAGFARASAASCEVAMAKAGTAYAELKARMDKLDPPPPVVMYCPVCRDVELERGAECNGVVNLTCPKCGMMLTAATTPGWKNEQDEVVAPRRWSDAPADKVE